VRSQANRAVQPRSSQGNAIGWDHQKKKNMWNELSGLLSVSSLSPCLPKATWMAHGKPTWTNPSCRKKPYTFSVNNGMYDCRSCIPTINVKADGQDQSVSGQPYDTILTSMMFGLTGDSWVVLRALRQALSDRILP
jgi:hypothetical protein